MNQDSSMDLISTLNGHGFDVKKYFGLEEIDEPGFYFNQNSCQIEHWSKECDYNKVMGLHNHKSQSGLIQDGWQSVLHFEDVDRLIQSIQVWDNHLTKYGVK